MRVAYVCMDPGVPVFGRKGSSVHVQSVLRSLLRRGHELDLLACRFDGPPPADLDNVTVHHLPRAGKGEPAARERALAAANGPLDGTLATLGRIDLVYERASLWSWAALEHAERTGTPTVLEVNAPLVEEQARHRDLVDRAGAERAAERQAATASVLAAVSPAVADHLRTAHPGAVARVHVVPNCVDPARFARTPEPDPARPFTIGFVGTLKPWHGLDTLVTAFAALHAARPGARLLVVGDGPGREALEHELAERELGAAATLTGAVEPDAVPGLLGQMDVSVAPYPDLKPFYFSPLKIVESMAAGVPVVASCVGGLEDLIADGRTGRLVPAEDPAALAAALVALAEDHAGRLQMGAAARRETLASRTWDAIIGRVLTLAATHEMVA